MIKPIAFIGILVAFSQTACAEAVEQSKVEEIYGKSCVVCHASGAAGAPKTGDKAAWQARIDAKGMDGMLESIHKGINAMPPKVCVTAAPTKNTKH